MELAAHHSDQGDGDDGSWELRAEPGSIVLHKKPLLSTTLGLWMRRQEILLPWAFLSMVSLGVLFVMSTVSSQQDGLVVVQVPLPEGGFELHHGVRLRLHFAVPMSFCIVSWVFCVFHTTNQDLFIRQLKTFDAYVVSLSFFSASVVWLVNDYSIFRSVMDAEWIVARTLLVLSTSPVGVVIATFDSVQVRRRWKILLVLAWFGIMGYSWAAGQNNWNRNFSKEATCLVDVPCSYFRSSYLSAMSNMVVFAGKTLAALFTGKEFVAVRANFKAYNFAGEVVNVESELQKSSFNVLRTPSASTMGSSARARAESHGSEVSSFATSIADIIHGVAVAMGRHRAGSAASDCSAGSIRPCAKTASDGSRQTAATQASGGRIRVSETLQKLAPKVAMLDMRRSKGVDIGAAGQVGSQVSFDVLDLIQDHAEQVEAGKPLKDISNKTAGANLLFDSVVEPASVRIDVASSSALRDPSDVDTKPVTFESPKELKSVSQAIDVRTSLQCLDAGGGSSQTSHPERVIRIETQRDLPLQPILSEGNFVVRESTSKSLQMDLLLLEAMLREETTRKTAMMKSNAELEEHNRNMTTALQDEEEKSRRLEEHVLLLRQNLFRCVAQRDSMEQRLWSIEHGSEEGLQPMASWGGSCSTVAI